MLNYLYIHSIEFILILTPSVMKDLVTAAILFAKSIGKLENYDLIVRYLRIKYSLKTSVDVIAKRVMFLEMQKPYSSY